MLRVRCVPKVLVSVMVPRFSRTANDRPRARRGASRAARLGARGRSDAPVEAFLTDEQTIDGIVEGSNDFGIDALYFEPPDDGELHVTLIQGKYKADLRGVSAFPENGISSMIAAIGALFDPSLPVHLNRRLTERIEDVRSFVKGRARFSTWRRKSVRT